MATPLEQMAQTLEAVVATSSEQLAQTLETVAAQPISGDHSLGDLAQSAERSWIN